MQRIWSEVKTKDKMVFNLFLIGSARDYLNYVDPPSIALVQSEKTRLFLSYDQMFLSCFETQMADSSSTFSQHAA